MRYSIGLKSSCTQKWKQNQFLWLLHAFSRALRQRHVINSSFDWFTGLSMSFVIG